MKSLAGKINHVHYPRCNLAMTKAFDVFHEGMMPGRVK